MNEPYIITEVQPGPSDVRWPSNGNAFDPQDWDLSSTLWTDIGLGIVLAGAAYPLVAALVICAVQLIVALTNALLGTEQFPPLEEVIGATIGTGAAAMFGAIVGAMFAAMVAILTAPFVCMFVRSLKLHCNLLVFGALWGGVVGMMCGFALLLTFGMGTSLNIDFTWDLVFGIAVAPAMTTALGQLGGAWGGKRARRRFFVNCDFATATGPRESLQPGTGETAAGREQAEHRFQFGIRHLLWIMVWVSVLLSLMRLVGVPLQWAVPCLVGWLAYQTVTLYVGWRLIRRLRPWWLRPQTQLAGRII